MTLLKDKWIYRDEIDLGPEEMRVGVVPDSNVAVVEKLRWYPWDKWLMTSKLNKYKI